ncbi:hypothetical protein TNCT_306851, partial [Trichonephila clavata]
SRLTEYESNYLVAGCVSRKDIGISGDYSDEGSQDLKGHDDQAHFFCIGQAAFRWFFKMFLKRDKTGPAKFPKIQAGRSQRYRSAYDINVEKNYYRNYIYCGSDDFSSLGARNEFDTPFRNSQNTSRALRLCFTNPYHSNLEVFIVIRGTSRELVSKECPCERSCHEKRGHNLTHPLTENLCKRCFLPLRLDLQVFPDPHGSLVNLNHQWWRK